MDKESGGNPRPGPIVGVQGVKYGLQLPQSSAGRGRGRGSAPRAAPSRPPQAFFGVDSDSEEDVGAQVARQGAQKRSAAKVQEQYAEALAQDPSVFDYDGVYDELHQAREAPKVQDKVDRKPKYIAMLLAKAEERKRQDDVTYERILLKERQKEDHLFEGKERFITNAYRKKLEEEAKWKEEERRKEEAEAAPGARGPGHMAKFYANLLTNNVAFGTATAPPPAEGEKGGPEAGTTPDNAAGEERNEGTESEGAPLDAYEKLRREAERRRGERRPQAEEANVASPGAADNGEGPQSSVQRDDEEGEGGAGPPKGADAAKAAAEAAQAAAAATAAAEAARLAAGKRRNDDSAVSNAKERYLARKRMAAAGGGN